MPRLTLIPDFVEAPDALFREIRDGVAWDERMKSRKTASFGVAYNYSGMIYPETEMPASLQPICARIQSAVGFLPTNCLMNYYPDGDSSMGFHSDNVEELREGTGVAIVSLGTEREIHFRSKADASVICRYLMTSGLLLYMGQDVQHEWMHAIPKVAESGERISLTFRDIIRV